MLKRGKIFENLGKKCPKFEYSEKKYTKYSEKGQVTECDNLTQ